MRGLNIAVFLLLAALWGGSFLFMRIAAPVLGPVWLIEVRVLLAGLALLPVVIRLNLLDEMRRNLMSIFIVGCINSAIPFLLFAFASLYLPAGFNSILNATSPLFATVVAFVWLKDWICCRICGSCDSCRLEGCCGNAVVFDGGGSWIASSTTVRDRSPLRAAKISRCFPFCDCNR
jgi:EamA-like transporter family